MRCVSLFLQAVVCALAGNAAHAQQGLTAPAAQDVWPRWQARLSLGPAALPQPSVAAAAPSLPHAGLRLAPSVGVLGDYYFSRFGLETAGRRGAWVGGFRATSGLVLGEHPRLGSQGLSMPAPEREAFRPADGEPAVVPYLGLGYTGLWSGSGWRFSADVGVVSQRPGSGLRLGRMVQGSQALDDVLQGMRLSPLVQLGASYSF